MLAPEEFPIILKPNLGCPHLEVLHQDTQTVTLRLLVAVRLGEFRCADSEYFTSKYQFFLRPSFPEPDLPSQIGLQLTGPPEPLVGWGSLPDILDPQDTAYLLSRELHYQTLGEATNYCFLPVTFTASASHCLHRAHGRAVPTLYDLFILDQTAHSLRRNPHAIQLMPDRRGEFQFLHVTDLHLARRNDEIIDDVLQTASGRERQHLPSAYVNFNANFRRFIAKANELADDGQLDFVLATGDLVDFAHHGWSDREDNDENNWMIFRDMVTGEGAEQHRSPRNEGLRVAIFTSTGNHDWRLHPYDLVRFGMHDEYGLTEEQAKRYRYNKFDPKLYPDEERDRLADQLAQGFFDQMVVDQLLAGLMFRGARTWGLQKLMLPLVRRWFLTPLIENPLHADPVALHYYFKHINPYLNYAFDHAGGFFAVLDSGPDVFTGRLAEGYGWRELRKLQIEDLLLGFAPDSKGLDSTRLLYNWSQLRWLERVLACAGRRGEGPIFVAVHAPPLNCSDKISCGELAKPAPMVMDPAGKVPGGPNLTYGALRHHVVDMLRLCTGCDGGGNLLGAGRPVAAILCGHAHRDIEFRVEAAAADKLRIWCDRFSAHPGSARWPLVLQTAACGPRRAGSGSADPAPDPPYGRLITVTPGGPTAFAQRQF